MYKLPKELRDELIALFYKLNAPVQTYESVQKTLLALEEIKVDENNGK
jgi:hypothetical protein